MGKAATTKQFIIETAAPLFNEKGIAGTSIDDVLKAAKVAKGCLYGHFSCKEELSYATVDYLIQKVSLHTVSRLNEQDTPTGRLLAFAELYKNPLKTVAAGGCPIINFGAEADDTNPVIRQKIKAAVQKTIKLLADIIQEGIKTKEFLPEVNAEEFAVKLFAAIEGGIMISRISGSNKPMLSVISSLKKEISSIKNI